MNNIDTSTCVLRARGLRKEYGRAAGLVRAVDGVVTHDPRIAATADRMISMRDGAFTDQTMLHGRTSGRLGALAGLEG